MKRMYIEAMRGNLGVKDNENDASQDARIEAMTPKQRLELICGWTFGDRTLAQQFINWAEDAGFKVTEKARKPS